MKIIRQNVSLRDYSKYKIGGSSAYFFEACSKEELVEGLTEWKEISENFPEEKKQIFVLSAGSNVLIDDGGFHGLVIHNNIKLIKKDGYRILVGSAVLIKDFLDFCIENSLSGFEWAGGLPGTIGGAVRGNAGAFGGETKDLIQEVQSLNLDSFLEKIWTKDECEFGYRTSIFKKTDPEFVLAAVFNFVKGNAEDIKKQIEEKINYRNEKHPMDIPSLGSTFKNIPIGNLSKAQQEEFKNFIKNDPMPVLPVAKLLYFAGLKGKRIGNAQVSEKHPNFIVNLGGAKSEDVKALISFVKEEIFKKYQIELEEEIEYLPK
jgi:UDP-N-acetylmuramate dehydrogenase